jgi:hypothetical protein
MGRPNGRSKDNVAAALAFRAPTSQDAEHMRRMTFTIGGIGYVFVLRQHSPRYEMLNPSERCCN